MARERCLWHKPEHKLVRLARHVLEVAETNDVRVLGVDGGERRQEGGRLADGALALVVWQKLEGLSLGLGHALEEEPEEERSTNAPDLELRQEKGAILIQLPLPYSNGTLF